MKHSKTPLPGAVLLLAALGFVLGTGEFVIVGILPEIAEGLDTSLAAVGKLVSVFAACYAVGTPVITAACGGISRKKLLAVLMGVFLLTGAVSFAAPNVAVLYAARVAAALVSGTLTAVAMLYAKEVAAPEQPARTIPLVYGGVVAWMFLEEDPLLSLQVMLFGSALPIALLLWAWWDSRREMKEP